MENQSLKKEDGEMALFMVTAPSMNSHAYPDPVLILAPSAGQAAEFFVQAVLDETFRDLDEVDLEDQGAITLARFPQTAPAARFILPAHLPDEVIGLDELSAWQDRDVDRDGPEVP